MKHVVIVLLLSALPALAADASVSGTWKVEGNVSGYAVDRLCTFKQDGKKLSGSCQNGDPNADDKAVLQLTGNVDDKNVTWKYDAEWNGSTLTVAYSGSWDGDSAITGAIDVQPVNAAGTFTAKKNK